MSIMEQSLHYLVLILHIVDLLCCTWKQEEDSCVCKNICKEGRKGVGVTKEIYLNIILKLNRNCMPSCTTKKELITIYLQKHHEVFRSLLTRSMFIRRKTDTYFHHRHFHCSSLTKYANKLL